MIRRFSPGAALVALALAAPLAGAQHLPADTAHAFTAKFGGQLRTRGEAVSHYGLATGPLRSDDYGTTHLVLRAALAAPFLRLDVEGRDAVAHSRALVDGVRPSDRDRLDLQALSLTAHCCAGAGEPGAALTVGRQRLSVGRERLVGASDWSNARRAFDGARLVLRRGPVRLEAFRARVVVVETDARNRADSLSMLDGVTLGGARGDGEQLYLLRVTQRHAGVEAPYARRATLGLRSTRALPAFGRLTSRYDLEGAWQGGHASGRTVDAWFAASELTARLAGRRVVPFAALGLDAASGDRRASDDRAGTFTVPYASAHSFGGSADVVGRPNGLEARLTSGATVGRAELRLDGRDFRRLRETDAAYGKSGTLRAAAPGSRTVGRELDATASLRLTSGALLAGGYAHFAPGRFLREAPAGAHPLDWGFASLTIDF